MRAGKHYRALAGAMAHRYSVLLVDRRGRGRSGPGRNDDGVETEVADLSAVLAATGAERVFGHSAGASISLEAAHRLPIRELALYEPPVEPLTFDWLPPFEAALARGKTARALSLAIDGLEMGPRGVPTWVMTLAARVLLHTAEGKEATALVAVAVARRRDGAIGPGPPRASRVLVLPHPAARRIGQPGLPPPCRRRAGGDHPGAARTTLDRQSHNAPDMDAPAAVATELLAFYS